MRLSALDPTSYSTPENLTTTHIDLDWTVNFEKRKINGWVLLKFKIINEISSIILDVSELKIDSITTNGTPLTYKITDEIDIGAKLTINLMVPTSSAIDILIVYETSTTASALQWLNPEQTLSKQYPFLFSQCEAIHARSLLPCQDTANVKFTYNAILRHPVDLVGLMGASITASENGITTFEQIVPIPSYLIAIAVGKLVSRRLGPISAVWAEEDIVDDAAYEFAETEDMIKEAERICGPYVWRKYDILVMPPSFPYGGMENPCLTFVTPALIARNRSLTSVIAHEIAHSWTGNLITNKTFEELWMNEGFTVFLEGKILGALKGADYRDFHSIHYLSELRHNIEGQLADSPELTRLIIDLTNTKPEDAFSLVPYAKGMTFLRYIEQCVGGPTIFDPFLRFYINKYKYLSVNTNDFKLTIYEYFHNKPIKLKALEQIDWELWLYGEGMPPVIPNYDQTLAKLAFKHATLWAESTLDTIKNSLVINENLDSALIVELLDKIRDYKIIVELNSEKINFLSEVYKIETDGNIEIRLRFFLLVIRARLIDRLSQILSFANSNFRMKYVRDIYRALGKWPEARPTAIANFHSVKNQMMKNITLLRTLECINIKQQTIKEKIKNTMCISYLESGSFIETQLTETKSGGIY